MDLASFECGIDALNNYLCIIASQQSNKDNTRTFMLEDIQNSESIVGYFTLTMTTLDLSLLPLKLQKKHKNAQSGGLITRLAVDKHYAKTGAIQFYKKFGFVAFYNTPNKLFMTLADVKASFQVGVRIANS